ncbi:MAG: hypothetical protein HKO92_06130 [Flavobacteriaceae bacterium]|nr:hypothetical protein [Bacteroidia bacterium]NNK82680.1 hypothetical protein [Flavobacteriaceae bacterium]
MIKKSLLLIFSLFFVLHTIVPSVLVLVDNSFDTTIVHNLSDVESENEENEVRKQIKFEFTEYINRVETSNSGFLLGSINYYLISFSELHLENISPPPEFT